MNQMKTGSVGCRSIVRRTLLSYAMLVGACAQDPGTGVDLSAPMQVPQSFDQLNQTILQPGCAAFSTCHSTTGARAAGQLNLEVDPYEQMVNIPASNKQAAEQKLMRVVPCDPGRSFLVMKIELPESDNDHDVGYGAHMPDSNPNLPPAQVQAIRDWIARGAKRSEPAGSGEAACGSD